MCSALQLLLRQNFRGTYQPAAYASQSTQRAEVSSPEIDISYQKTTNTQSSVYIAIVPVFKYNCEHSCIYAHVFVFILHAHMPIHKIPWTSMFKSARTKAHRHAHRKTPTSQLRGSSGSALQMLPGTTSMGGRRDKIPRAMTDLAVPLCACVCVSVCFAKSNKQQEG